MDEWRWNGNTRFNLAASRWKFLGVGVGQGYFLDCQPQAKSYVLFCVSQNPLLSPAISCHSSKSQDHDSPRKWNTVLALAWQGVSSVSSTLSSGWAAWLGVKWSEICRVHPWESHFLFLFKSPFVSSLLTLFIFWHLTEAAWYDRRTVWRFCIQAELGSNPTSAS